MQKFVILSAATLLVALGAVVGWSTGGESPVVARVAMSQGAATQTAPGVYVTRPYSTMLLAPHPVDVGMAVNPDGASSEMPVMKPENRLEKK